MNPGSGADWRPTARPEALKARAALYRRLRAFFDARGVLEVETPVLSHAATVDRHLESFRTAEAPPRWLQTSPEFAMKRLLCAGSGPIWQLCKVFRADECGAWHNPEFTILEWYRPGFDHHALMDEVQALLEAVGGPAGPYPRLSYREAFERHAGFDPFTVSEDRLAQLPQGTGLSGLDRDGWLDLWMSHVVGPRLGEQGPCFVHGFPASQAALARVVDGEAQRFELFWGGLELANGFWELGDASEQRQRFETELEWRRAQGKPQPPVDERLLAALAAGLPDCAGVAIGVDRLLMRLTGAARLHEVLAFPADRA